MPQAREVGVRGERMPAAGAADSRHPLAEGVLVSEEAGAAAVASGVDQMAHIEAGVAAVPGRGHGRWWVQVSADGQLPAGAAASFAMSSHGDIS